MKKLLGSKSFILLLGLATILAVLYLSAGISALKFMPAQSFSFDLPALPKANPQAPLTTSDLWMVILTGVMVFLFIAAVLYAIFNPEQRKKLLIALVRLAVLTAILLLIRANIKAPPKTFTLQATMASPPLTGNTGGQVIAPPPFVPPHLPAWEVYLLSLVVLLVLGGGIWWLLWLTRKNRSSGALADFERIARTTLDEIGAGAGWEDAIVQCYVRMSHAVNARRKLAREAAMTPTEFSAQLQIAGLPAEAVRRLTLLFERVRYGAKRSSQADIAEAVDCLTSILQACQETA